MQNIQQQHCHDHLHTSLAASFITPLEHREGVLQGNVFLHPSPLLHTYPVLVPAESHFSFPTFYHVLIVVQIGCPAQRSVADVRHQAREQKVTELVA